jgi:hypothetical protein
LLLDFDPVILVLLHDILYTILKEAVEGGNLLGDETVLAEVRLYHGPGVFIFNLSIEKLLLCLRVNGLVVHHHIYIL